jgi:hypothetical protein
MKKLKIGILALMFSGFSYSQSIDTICNMVMEKQLLTFDYYESQLTNLIKSNKYKDYTIEIKENEVLILDLYDGCNNCNDNITERKITIYYKHKKSMEYFYPSIDNTIFFDGKEINKIIISKPNETK